MVRAENLSKRYGRRWALAGVTLEIRTGAVVVVAGHNGSGKSTLFRLIATAIRPDGGELTIDGFTVRTEKEDIRHRVALLSHYSYLYESLTAAENLAVAAQHLGKPVTAVPSLLARVGLAERAGDAVGTFSAGMRKRLSFARVLLQEARLVLLDEPYGQLDPQGFSLVDDVVGELRRSGVTVLMATHQLERGAALADDAIVLERGRVRWAGAASALVQATGGLA